MVCENDLGRGIKKCCLEDDQIRRQPAAEQRAEKFKKEPPLSYSAVKRNGGRRFILSDLQDSVIAAL